MTDVVESGKDAFLVCAGDEAGLAGCTLHLIERRSARGMGQRGRRKVVRNRSWDTMVGSFEDLSLTLSGLPGSKAHPIFSTLPSTFVRGECPFSLTL